ncbi:unnamed protein product [Wickerhamomyces anomalus]
MILSRIQIRPSLIRCAKQSKPNQILIKRTFISSPMEVIDYLTATLQTIHTVSGIPWWALIPLTTIAFRSCWTLPIAILQRKRTQKQNELRPIINAMGPVLRLKLASKAQAAQVSNQKLNQVGGVDALMNNAAPSAASSLNYEQIMLLSVKERRERQKKLFKQHNCQLYKNFLLPAFQIPLWVAMSFTFRNLSGWTDITSKPLDSSLIHEGIFWFQDLTVMDPLGIMPVALGVLALTNVEWNYKTMELQNFSSAKRSLRPTAFDAVMNISRISIVFLMAVCTQAPAALGLYWISSNAFSSVQNMLLDYYLPVRYSPRSRFSYKKASKDATPLFTRNI